MTEDIFRKRPILGNRILNPTKDITASRPQVNLNQPEPKTNSNLKISDSNQNSESTGTINMNNNDDLTQSLKALGDLIDSEPSSQPDTGNHAALVETSVQPAVSKIEKPSMVSSGGTKGNVYFKFPSIEPPFGGNIHSLKWTGNRYEEVEAAGSTSDYVRYNQWHLNGATIWIGTSATGAVDKVGVDPASGVTGLIPQATKQIAELIRSSKELSNGKAVDGDGRPYQFAVIAVLGGQDHKAICNAMEGLEANKIYRPVFDHLGIKGVAFRAALYNSMGDLFALEVTFANKEKYGHGRHIIFLHKANDIGGGKSDESLIEGRLSNQVSSLSKEFDWWISGLERAGGKIGSIETTLGGTARIGRYALLASCVPRSLFAADAFEVVNLDSAEWVKENLPSQIQEYRSNFATTLLRTAWGKAGARLHGVPIVLVNRFDRSMIRTRRMRANIATLRHMFLGNSKLDLLQGDISDERIAIQREQAITENKFMTIHDTKKNSKFGPWEQQRRIRLSTSISLTPSKVLSLAQGDDPTLAKDVAETVLERVRGLATSQNDALPSGGFTVVDALIPTKLLEQTGNVITKNVVSKAIETIAVGLRSSGIDKPLINLYKVPEPLCAGVDDVIVQFSEDQPGTNILIVSTDDIETHSKRTIMSNPNLRAIDNPTVSTVFAFGRLLGRMVTAHLESKYHHCEDDGALIHAFHRHYYGGNYGNRPNLLVGGTDRIRKKKDNDE
jgi:hypothetical protein